MKLRNMLILLICCTVSIVSCNNDGSDNSLLPLAFSEKNPGQAASAAENSGGTLSSEDIQNIEKILEENQNLEPGPLADDSQQALSQEIEDKVETETITNLNVKVTIPRAQNPHSDGDTDLWATVIRPDTKEKLPTILVATAYRRELMMLMYLSMVDRGYNLMVIDVRGSGSSGGAWSSFDLVEQYDIKYVVDEFIPAQEWSDGRVGMVGPSYMAIILMQTAGLIDTDPETGEPEHLKAIFPIMPMADAYRDIIMHGGNIDLEFIPVWIGLVDILSIMPGLLNLGEDEKPNLADMETASSILQQHIANIPVSIDWIMDSTHNVDGEFYDKKSPMIYWPVKPEAGWGFPEGDNHALSSKIPVFMTGGWFGIFTNGVTNHYKYGLSGHSDSNKALIIGQYYHLDGSMNLELNSLSSCNLQARWFDWKLKGKDDPFMEEFPVLLYVMGENKWRAEKSWPLPENRTEQRSLYLTKYAPSPIDGDWYTDEPWWMLIKQYKDNNYGLSEIPDYSGNNLVLNHYPLLMNSFQSRSVPRWLMGFSSMVTQASKYMLDKDIDADLPWEDERHNEKDALTFTTEPLGEDLEISGPLTLTFWAKTRFPNPLNQLAVSMFTDMIKGIMNIDANMFLDAMNKKDVQWVVEVNDVMPDGRARNITSGWLSAWHRQYDPSGATTEYYGGGLFNRTKIIEHAVDPGYTPHDPFYDGPDKNPKSINEGELYQYKIELWPTCNVFKKGNRIRVSISASDFPHLVPVLIASENTIVIDENHEARLDFSATKNDGEGDTWKWIGNSEDADEYLMSGGNAGAGCGSIAGAASLYSSRADYMLAGILGTLFMMMFPLAFIYILRFIRKRKLCNI